MICWFFLSWVKSYQGQSFLEPKKTSPHYGLPARHKTHKLLPALSFLFYFFVPHLHKWHKLQNKKSRRWAEVTLGWLKMPLPAARCLTPGTSCWQSRGGDSWEWSQSHPRTHRTYGASPGGRPRRNVMMSAAPATPPPANIPEKSSRVCRAVCP